MAKRLKKTKYYPGETDVDPRETKVSRKHGRASKTEGANLVDARKLLDAQRQNVDLHVGRYFGEKTVNKLERGHPFRKRVAEGEFGEPPTPHKIYIGLLDHCLDVERKLWVEEGFLRVLDTLGQKVNDVMLNYFHEIGDPITVRVGFKKIMNEVDAMGIPTANWRLIETADGDSVKFSIDYGRSDYMQAIWVAGFVGSDILDYGVEHRIYNERVRQHVATESARGRIEKIGLESDSMPSLVLDMQAMGMDGKSMSRHIRMMAERANTADMQASTEAGKIEKAIRNALEVYHKSGRKADKVMSDKRFHAALVEGLEPFGRDIYTLKIWRNRLAALKNMIAPDRNKRIDDYTIIDEMARSIERLDRKLRDSEGENETLASRLSGMDNVLSGLMSRTEEYADALGMGDRPTEEIGDITGALGSRESHMLNVCSNRITKVMEESMRRAEESGSIDAEKERERADENFMELQNTRNELALREGIIGADPNGRERYEVQVYLDRMSMKLMHLYGKFGEEYNPPKTKHKVISEDACLDILGAMKRQRRLLENMGSTFDAMERDGRDLKEPGSYMMKEVGNILGIEFNDVADMRYTIHTLVSDYRKKEGVIERVQAQEASVYRSVQEGPNI